jgi:hypothetical protein
MASGTQSTTRQLGGALGVAIMGSLLAARYSSELTRMLTGTPAARYLPAATKSLAGALQAAPPGTPSQAVLTVSAKAAFVDAVHVVAWGLVGCSLAAAGIVYFVLARAAELPEPEPSAIEIGPMELGAIEMATADPALEAYPDEAG